MRLVQITRGAGRRIGLVDGNQLHLLNSFFSVYALATEAINKGTGMTEIAASIAGHDTVDYEAIYAGKSQWRLLPPFDHPDDPAHCLVSGTGLTHKASAENRAAMHGAATTVITDSMRMYQLGIEGGRPEPGQIGVQPEWFYKGDGSVLKAHGEELLVPSFADDGGEEPEIAGAYLIAPDGTPYRVGFMTGNEFSDHKMEKKNYLYLAPSKLRNCSIGPELAIGDIPFDDCRGTVTIFRNGVPFWNHSIHSGEKNMSHSLANLEYHHFKYSEHRRPGDVHIHFFGADAFSFGGGIALESGDVMEVSFPQFGRPLRNLLKRSTAKDEFVPVRTL